ncbi:MAG: hypothetical protein SFW36_07780 [Leptolyngbyaceae cyanobacterium bins.59]|nr:hypothetical protein [Leptolyngbyaceae cyanobacterium bins.59]
MMLQLVILIAALIVSGLVFSWLINVVKTTVTTAISIAILLLILQLSFGIGPQQLWQQVTQIPQWIWQTVRSGR